MGDLLGARVVFLLTLLGLAGCAVVATLHPDEVFDPARVAEQAGRNVSVHFDVASVRSGGDMLRGDGHATAAPASRVEWIWFRAPEAGPLPGDRLVGHALLSVDARGAVLVLDGPNAARIEPGPHPVPVHWGDLTTTPERFAGRLLTLNGAIDGAFLRAPDGRTSCPLSGVVPDEAHHAERHLVVLERTAARPGWTCRLEG